MRKLGFVFCLLLSQVLTAQEGKQVVRGQVLDVDLQRPIPYAVVSLLDLKDGVIADSLGHFRFDQVPLGLHTLKVSAIGFNESYVNSFQVISGKETVLTIKLEEKINLKREIVVKGKGLRSKPMNEMSIVSARSFTVEETQKYAAAVNDPARMATNFAGVASADDGNNQIVIRGNSPMGMIWRMEGIEIPNPNHFAALGGSGGGISILSAQLLDNSDFLTSAFAPEYGNALSGVFDLSLRKGNNEHREYTAQLGLLGLNLAAEGPFSSKSKGSYLINYRYSTLSILNKMGLKLTPSTTNFQDLSYHLFMPTVKYGDFSIFSFGGLSNQFFQAEKDSSLWKVGSDRYSDEFVSNTGMWGLSHKVNLGKKAYLKSVIAYANLKTSYDRDYQMSANENLAMYRSKYKTNRLSLSMQYNRKLNPRLTWRSGAILSSLRFGYTESYRETVVMPLRQFLSSQGTTQNYQGYTNLQYKWHNKLILTGGFHGMFLALNQTYSVEPRFSIRWTPGLKHAIGFGYGNHGQLQPLGIYFYRELDNMPNYQLQFSKAHHLVGSYQYQASKTLRIKSEIYYQYLYQIPISIYDTSTFSMLNAQGDYEREALRNRGVGKNYGLEISMEKMLSKNFYYMIALSLYESKYKAANGKWYNTRFNGNELLNVVAGKDFVFKQSKRTIGVHMKSMFAGGYRTTPIDVASSTSLGKVVYYTDRMYSEKLPDYYRFDLRLLYKWNAAKTTHTLSLDIQNVTNRQNIYDRYFDVESSTIKTYYQLGILPILNYKVEF
jgi:hypothetical protein